MTPSNVWGTPVYDLVFIFRLGHPCITTALVALGRMFVFALQCFDARLIEGKTDPIADARNDMRHIAVSTYDRERLRGYPLRSEHEAAGNAASDAFAPADGDNEHKLRRCQMGARPWPIRRIVA